MVLPLYLAQTAGEMAGNPVSGNPAYLACHFSPWGSGLSNIPVLLPPGTLLILDDANPWADHAPEMILAQLTQTVEILGCEAVLLDFERPGSTGQQHLAQLLTKALPCPVGVSMPYAGGLTCPVFLPPVPPNCPLAAHIAPWQGREIWLEAALNGLTLTLTEAGCSSAPLPCFPEAGLADDKLHCQYTIETAADTAIFRLWRTQSDLDALLQEAEAAGITRAIGLWQELRSFKH